MAKERVGRMEMLEVILNEVKHVRREQAELRKENASGRKDLREHIKDETIQFNKIKDDMHSLSKENALTKQWGKVINGGIAMITAGIVSWLVLIAGKHGP